MPGESTTSRPDRSNGSGAEGKDPRDGPSADWQKGCSDNGLRTPCRQECLGFPLTHPANQAIIQLRWKCLRLQHCLAASLFPKLPRSRPRCLLWRVHALAAASAGAVAPLRPNGRPTGSRHGVQRSSRQPIAKGTRMKRMVKPVRHCHGCGLNLGTRCGIYEDPHEMWRNRTCPGHMNQTMFDEYNERVCREEAGERKRQRRQTAKARATEDHHQGTRQSAICSRH